MAPSATQSVGAVTEARAQEYLQERGLSTRDRNFRCRFGEIDIVMMDQNCLVFVEVRYRRNNHYYTAAQSVGRAKQRKLTLTASAYLRKHPRLANRPCRFDVIAIDGSNQQHSEIQWIKDAFRPGE